MIARPPLALRRARLTSLGAAPYGLPPRLSPDSASRGPAYGSLLRRYALLAPALPLRAAPAPSLHCSGHPARLPRYAMDGALRAAR